MVATTTVQITWLVKTLKHDYPKIQFIAGKDFHWDKNTSSVYYVPDGNPGLLLHELGHGILNHASYSADIELLSMEVAAWEVAKDLAKKYLPKQSPDELEELAEGSLDSYRDWLHSRSLCPNCGATGLQTRMSTYSCPACDASWQVNSAKKCQLRRTLK